MATLAEARARWVAENPIGSPGYDLPQTDYDALADDRQTMMLEVMIREEEDAARDELRQIITNYLQTLADNETLLVNGITTLKGPTPPATIAALRTYVTAMAEMTLDHNRGIDRLIRYLVRTGVIG